MKSSVIISLALAVFLAVQFAPAVAQVVSPMQSGHYFAGVTNVRDMGNPPPGLFVIWYNVWFATDTYVDRNGDELTSLRLSQIDPTYPDVDLNFDINGFATVPALFWASQGIPFLGNARYMAGISPNYVTSDGTIIATTGGGVSDSTVTKVEEGKVSGFSDLFVVPVGLSWGFEKFDATLTYGFYAPTGRYSTGATDNVGLGFWTHQFQGYGYFYPFPDKSTAAMVGLTYEINGTIEDVDVKPGSRFTVEWGVSQYLSEQLEVSIQGGHNFQVGDDSGSDVFWDTGVHDSKNNLGFGLAYWPWKNRLYVSGKYMFDIGSKQRFDNKYIMLNAIFLTNWLTGS